MTSKRVAFGFLAALGLCVAISFATAPHAFSRDFHDRGRGDDDDDSALQSDSRVQIGFQIAPVPLNVQDKRGLVGLGSYIVNAQSGCNDCHTCPPYAAGHDPYQGGDGQVNATNYLAGGHNFGPVTSANITPDPVTGLPAGLTLDQFIQVIRTGHDPQPPNGLLQVMPWPIFRHMTDRDLRAVYAYLKAIPHAEPGVCLGP